MTGATNQGGTVVYNGIKSGSYSFYITYYGQTNFCVTVTPGQTTSLTIHVESPVVSATPGQTP
ncbi:MAG: hypothetical protein PHV74_15880 [Dehalococcoidia bacterium]|nr:hypothetical protein [Dehalococcoidia bacterium]